MTDTIEKDAPVAGTPDIDGRDVGERIAFARRVEGMKQKDLAERIGVIPRTIQNYENGRIPWDHLEEIATVLKRSKDWILYGNVEAAELTRFPGDLPREVRDEFANRHDEVMDELRAQSQLLRDLMARVDKLDK
jgi:transcriptional regulator with XRE-family HTH domain